MYIFILLLHDFKLYSVIVLTNEFMLDLIFDVMILNMTFKLAYLNRDVQEPMIACGRLLGRFAAILVSDYDYYYRYL